MAASLDNHHLHEETKLDSSSDEEGSSSFHDLVIKFSNLRTLLEPSAGKYGNAYDGDICHKIGKTDYAVIAGVSEQDNLPGNSVGNSATNDARVMSDICRIHFGMKPSRVKLLTSHTKKPNRKNIKHAIKEGLKNASSDDLVLIYFSGHGHVHKDEHFLLPQDFRTDDIKGSGISAQSLYRWIAASKCNKILFLLDCCYAEQFAEALFLARGRENSNKHLYLLSSSEMSEPSVSDEMWLEHGYMTFLIKHHFNYNCVPTQQLSMRQLTRFIKKYTVPLSRFTYTVYDGQVTQRPKLTHLGPDSLVEHDAGLPGEVNQELLDYWLGYLRKTSTYNSWWQERLLDAKVLLGDTTFSYSRVNIVVFLNSLHSLAILLCERDHVHEELSRHDQYTAFCAALHQIVSTDLKTLAHPDHEMEMGEARPRVVIDSGISEGIRLVKEVRASAPSREAVYADTIATTV